MDNETFHPMFGVLLHKLGGEITISEDYAFHVCRNFGSVETIRGGGNVTYRLLPREGTIIHPNAIETQKILSVEKLPEFKTREDYESK